MRLYGLDLLRGIAAFAVAVHHLAGVYGLAPPPLLPALAVDLFFILSGFVMTRTYEERLRGAPSTPSFMLLRWRRLFLPAAVGASIGLAWAVLRFGLTPDLGAAFVLSLAFLPAIWLADCFILNGPAWSLFLEIGANALHSSLFARMSTRMLAGLWLISTAAFSVMFLMGLSKWGPGIGAVMSLAPRAVACYLTGILTFRLFGDAPLGNRPYLAILAFIACLVIAPLNPFLELAATIIAAPLIVRGSIALGRSQLPIWFGALSYPLYAVHQPTMRLAYILGWPPLVALSLALIIAATLALQFERSRSLQRQARNRVAAVRRI